ncbi:MAG: xylulokinase [Methanocella sp.]
MSKKHVMGIDVGTTGIKVTVFDAGGHVVAEEYTEYPLICERPGWAEQDPNQWWSAVKESLIRLMQKGPVAKDEVLAIGTTGQQPSPVLIGRDGRGLCNSLIWMDRRTVSECEAVQEAVGTDRLYALSGLRPDPMYAIYKVLWIKNHRPEAFREAWKVLQPKDYINFKLTGKVASDFASSAATQAVNLQHLAWEPEILRAAGLSVDLMPPMYPATQILGTVEEGVAAELGLSSDTLVVVGGGDTTVSALGCGVLEVGDTAVVIGTSSDVVTCTARPVIDPKKRMGCYPYVVGDKYMTIAGGNSSGIVLKWFRDQFYQADAKVAAAPGVDLYDLMTSEAAQVPAGCEGLVLLPYLTGERSPIYNPYARGVFGGITLRHTRAHFTRAIIEGVSLSIRDRLAVSREAGVKPGRVILAGGGAKSAFWRQVITDMLGCSTCVAEVKDAAGLGAAILAAVGAGLYPSAAEAREGMVSLGRECHPDPANRETYDRLYSLYKTLYLGNVEFFDQLAHQTNV